MDSGRMEAEIMSGLYITLANEKFISVVTGLEPSSDDMSAEIFLYTGPSCAVA